MVKCSHCGSNHDQIPVLISVHIAAKRFGLKPKIIRRYCRQRKFNATKVGGDWFINEADLEASANKLR